MARPKKSNGEPPPDVVPQVSQNRERAAHRQGRHLRPASRVRHQARVRQSRLDRTAVPERLARRHRLRARPAGGERRRHGRWLCAGDPQCRLRQSAFRRRRRQCARQYLHRPPQPDAAGHHGGPAGPLDPAAAGLSLRRARLGISTALRQIQRRAGARRRRAGGDRARLLRRDAAALRADLRFDPDRRLDTPGAADRSPPRQPRTRPRSGRHEGAGCSARGEQAPCPRRRTRRRSRRRRRPDGAGRGEGEGGRLGQPVLGALLIPGTASAVRRFPARLAGAAIGSAARS